jgi:steroid delta-isomerase-like uncharacterized protein
MGVAENKAVAGRFLNEIVGKGNWDAAGEVMAEDIIVYHPSAPGGSLHGLEPVKQLFMAFRAGFPDLTIITEDVIAEDDRVAVRWRGVGTNTGEFFGAPPTGKAVDVGAVSIFTIHDGKIVEDHISEDTLGMLKQLGVIPA